jgi:glycosyltransferase involved in cell wall biosynthesis
MRFGAPILTSDLDFAREVCGEAAEYFDPWSPRSIAEAIGRVLSDPGRAEALVSRGRERLKRFPTSWDAVARETIRGVEAIVR